MSVKARSFGRSLRRRTSSGPADSFSAPTGRTYDRSRSNVLSVKKCLSIGAVHIDDASHVPTLLDQLTQDPASFMADGAYDRAATYDAILARNPSARFIVPPCKGSVPGPTATISPTQRDLHVLAVDEHGRMNWQKASGYNTRSKVEAAISRYKRVIGDTLKSRHDTRRATEVAIAIKSLNRMNQLGRAIFTRIA